MHKFLLFLLILSAIVLSACGKRPLPRWDGEFWAGNHAIPVGNQRVPGVEINHPDTGDHRVLYAQDPKFSDGVWLTYQDLGCLYQQLILNCESWKKMDPVCKPVDTQGVRMFLNSGRP